MSTATLMSPAAPAGTRRFTSAPDRTGEFQIPAPGSRTRRAPATYVPGGPSVRPRGSARTEPRRPDDRRPVGTSPATTRRRPGTRCAAPVVDRRRIIARRRAAAVAVLVGVGLALMVWVVGIVGSNYAASVAPAPAGTEVVHVRQGDSLSSIADRVAPDMPRQTVIEEIMARNDLSSSGLRVGQALVAPAYH